MTQPAAVRDYELAPVKFSRLTRRGVLLGLSGPQLIVVGAAAVTLVFALYFGGTSLVYVVPILILCAALSWVGVGGRKLVVGVDRLDYSKGIAPRIEAFGEFLALHPEWRRKVTYVQIATPSRMDVREYRDVGHRVDEAVSRVNSHLGEPDWAPIRLVKKAYPYAAICGLYRVADAALVTPMRDGMNLVAKEFVAAQTEEDPGALILSRFAGAAFRMREALIVNPFDSLDMVEALRAALDMPVEERRRRWKALRADIELRDIHWWTQAYLRALTRAR